MQSAPQIAFHGLEPSDRLRALVDHEIAKLERWFDRITTIRVVIEAPPHHSKQGGQFKVNLQIGVPDTELIVDREPGRNERHEDPAAAVRDAFKAGRRRVQDYARKRRGEMKMHEEAPTARVRTIDWGSGDGFLETFDGREIYFHANALLNCDLDDLEEGARVRFVEEQGIKGPQASTVHVL